MTDISELLNAIDRALNEGLTDDDVIKKHAFDRIFDRLHGAIQDEHEDVSGGPLNSGECVRAVALYLGSAIRLYGNDSHNDRLRAVAHVSKLILQIAMSDIGEANER